MEAIFTRCHQEIWSLNRPQKSQIFPKTTQTQWITSKMILEVARLWLYITAYSRENKHQSRYTIKKRS